MYVDTSNTSRRYRGCPDQSMLFITTHVYYLHQPFLLKFQLTFRWLIVYIQQYALGELFAFKTMSIVSLLYSWKWTVNVIPALCLDSSINKWPYSDTDHNVRRSEISQDGIKWSVNKYHISPYYRIAIIIWEYKYS